LQARTNISLTVLISAILIIGSIALVFTSTYLLGLTTPLPNQKLAFAQESNESSSSSPMIPGNETSANVTVPTLTTPGAKEFYLFTAEIPDVDEETLKVGRP
jgi:hypothetical protein